MFNIVGGNVVRPDGSRATVAEIRAWHEKAGSVPTSSVASVYLGRIEAALIGVLDRVRRAQQFARAGGSCDLADDLAAGIRDPHGARLPWLLSDYEHAGRAIRAAGELQAKAIRNAPVEMSGGPVHIAPSTTPELTSAGTDDSSIGAGEMDIRLCLKTGV